MDPCSSVSVLWYKKSKPQGKVRRRVQDLRVPSSSSCDFLPNRPDPDLSHNESARLAADCLLSRGLDGYYEMLNQEGEVDFLSGLDKRYILENWRDGNTDDAGTDQEDNKDLDGLSSGSESPTSCSVESTDSDPTLADLDPNGLKAVKPNDRILNDSRIEVVFQSDSRGAGMKDLVRQFIRKAKLALAIVMDTFSDVELLCDLLEASRKRNVSVHLLLDRLNMNLFVNMWQELNLNSKNFPKLSVRSVHGQTYCSKTGRKLTGQITASFIITDWAEVLTGSYSFSWLSWQVHRSLAVLMKGSTVAPFHQEFHRLHSGSRPVPGFVTFITLPPSLFLNSRPREAQNDDAGVTKRKSNQNKTNPFLWAWIENTERLLWNPPSSGDDAGLQTQIPTPQPNPKPPCAQPEARRNVEPLEKNQGQIHRHSNPPDHTHFSYVQPQLSSVTITENNARLQEQTRTGRYRSTLTMKNSSLDHPDVAPEGFFFQQRSRNVQRGQWNYSLNFKPKVELQSDNPKLLIPANTRIQLPFSSTRGPSTGPQTAFLETRRQDQLHPNSDSPASAGLSSHLRQDSKLFIPGSRTPLQPPSSQQRLSWTPQSNRTGASALHGSFRTNAGGRPGWRTFQSGMNPSLARSKSMNDGHTAGLHQNRA